MKKIKTLGIIAAILMVAVMAVLAVFAAIKFFGANSLPESEGEVTITPEEEKPDPLLEWQSSETEGDITAKITTESGELLIKLADCPAAEKFIELKNSGIFDNAEFVTLAENMFIQTGVYGESFSLEQTGYIPLSGAVAFVMDGEKAAPSIVIITAEELSGASKAFLSGKEISSRKAELYENSGGIPEYEGKIIVFGMVVSGMETAEKIENGKNSGYTGGYSAETPEKIISVEIISPEETAE